MQKTDNTIYDLVIIGAGPAGLTAAVYAGREGMKAAVLEKGVVGGMAAITDMIDNYPGFEQGIPGAELADRLRAQAERFGAELKIGVDVRAITRDEETGLLTVATDGEPLETRSVLIATGSTYRHLDVPGEAELIGKGVSFCATCDGPMYRGRELVVVGGGNSAVQEALFLTKFASRVKLLARGTLRASEVLQEDLKRNEKVEVVFNTSVTSLKREGAKLRLEVIDNETKKPGELETDGVFVFVGLLANTEQFAGSLDLDERNFIVTDAHFQTSLPGVYAAGDVRSGSTWQIASAVGEAASAALSIREYLNELKRAGR